MNQARTNLRKLFDTPGSVVPLLLRNLDVVLGTLGFFLLILPYVLVKKAVILIRGY